MAGFLDKDTRIIDMVLTGYGKSLLSRGELNFCYWVPFDDEVDYDPHIAESGSLSAVALSSSIADSIENTLVREATTGYRMFNLLGKDQTNVINPVFTTAQKQDVLPRIAVSGSVSVTTYQRKVKKSFVVNEKDGKGVAQLSDSDVGVERFNSSQDSIKMGYEKDGFVGAARPDGFFVTVFESGSNGLVELKPKRDVSNDLCFGSDLKVHTGEE